MIGVNMNRPIIAALFLLAGIALQLPAQRSNEDNTPRSVQGLVTNDSGRPVEKAAVQLKDTKSLQIRSFITGPDGRYHFAGLSPNVEYELKAESQGVSSSKKSLSVFNSKKSVTIDLKLKK